MKFPDHHHYDLGAESGEDAVVSTNALESRLAALNKQLSATAQAASSGERAWLELAAARLLLDLERSSDAWRRARPAFDALLQATRWEAAIEASEVLFLANQEDSLSALGQGVWLAVTFPVRPSLTVDMLRHLIDETPDDADGAAVAAATAAYVVELRAEGALKNDLSALTMQLLGTVARRHSGIDRQDAFDAWVARLELSDPAKFLVRLRNVVDVLVQDDWWFDRAALQARLPVS